MRYLPIMGELLSSDSFIFMLIGLVVAAIIGIVIKNTKKNIVGLGMCFAIYVISEIISNIRSSYLVEIILHGIDPFDSASSARWNYWFLDWFDSI